MKRFIAMLVAIVMLMQGMQVAVAGVVVPRHGRPQIPAIEKLAAAWIMANPEVGASAVANAQMKASPTGVRAVSTVPLGTAGGRVTARLRTVADPTEVDKGLKAGTQMLVSSETSKLTAKMRAALKRTPKLTHKLFPGSEDGSITPGKAMRVTFQAGETLNLSGKVTAGVRTRSTVVMEEATVLADGTLGAWYPIFTLFPDAKGRFSQDYKVKAGIKAVRARLLVQSKNTTMPKVTAASGSTGTPVSTSAMPFNTFGITTPPWQVANHQGFDNNGNYYDSGYTGPSTSDPVDGTPIVWRDITFPIGPVPTDNKQVGGSSGPQNVVHANGQTIDIPAGSFNWLYLAGAGANGNQLNQPFTLTYTDGSTETWAQSFTDWGNNGTTAKPIPFPGEEVIQEQSYRINQLGNQTALSTYVYSYAYHLKSPLASITLPTNDNLGILSVVAATESPLDGSGVKSYLLSHINVTGTDLVTLKINNQQSDPLTFSVANWPQDGCDPTTTTTGCTYSTESVTVNQGQTQTVTYVAPTNYNNLGFSVQKADNVCVGPNCSTYLPNWSAGVNGTSCNTLSPSPAQSMAPGQTWTITAQGQVTGYNGFLDSPQVSNMPASQNSGKYPNGCVFAMNTSFQNWVADQPGWAKWLEGIAGALAIVGISFLTFGAPEDIGAVVVEVGADDLVAGDAAAGLDDTIIEESVEEEMQTDEDFRAAGERMRVALRSTISSMGSLVW